MKLQILKNKNLGKPYERTEEEKFTEVIIVEPVEKVEYKDNKKTIITTYKETNLTKKINETSKLVKNETLLTKLKELEQAIK